jgi:hypothetical protein
MNFSQMYPHIAWWIDKIRFEPSKTIRVMIFAA